MIFRKFIEKIRVPLKSVKENAHFTGSPVYILIIPRSVLRGMWNFSNKVVGTIKTHILYSKSVFEIVQIHNQDV